MLLLGLLLLCATGAFTGLVIADNLSGGPDYQVTVLGNTIATMNGLAIFLSGLALALVFCLGLALTGLGGRMARRRRAALKDARRHLARHGRTGDAVPTTPNGAPVPATEPSEKVPAGAAPAAEASSPQASSSSPSPRRHMHLFGH